MVGFFAVWPLLVRLPELSGEVEGIFAEELEFATQDPVWKREKLER